MIIDDITLARPYAQAIFALALEHQQLDAWKQLLEYWAAISLECSKNKLLINPQINREQLLQVFSLIEEPLAYAEALLKLLILKKHLGIVPHISYVFNELFYAHNHILLVKVSVPYTLKVTLQQQLYDTLTQYFQSQIVLQIVIKPALIGGMLIQTQKLTIDGTVAGVLKRLRQQLIA